jgi:hypothetical protein
MNTENENKKKSSIYNLKYMKKRYENDEEYRNKQIEKGKLRYQLNKESILNRYYEDEELRKRHSINSKKYYLKKKEERKAKEEAEKDEVHIINNS